MMLKEEKEATMARMMLMVELCLLPAVVSANRPVANPLIVEGRVYCDTCRAGYETNATTPIPDLRENSTLGPDTGVVADDGGGGEVIAPMLSGSKMAYRGWDVFCSGMGVL